VVCRLHTSAKMVLADLGRKITAALRSLSSATVINEEVVIFGHIYVFFVSRMDVGESRRL